MSCLFVQSGVCVVMVHQHVERLRKLLRQSECKCADGEAKLADSEAKRADAEAKLAEGHNPGHRAGVHGYGIMFTRVYAAHSRSGTICTQIHPTDCNFGAAADICQNKGGFAH